MYGISFMDKCYYAFQIQIFPKEGEKNYFIQFCMLVFGNKSYNVSVNGFVYKFSF